MTHVKDIDPSRFSKVYYDPSKPEGYAGAERLKKKFPKEEKSVTKWLATQASYTLHKPIKRKFPTRKYKTSGPNDLWQMDLMEMIPYASINKSYKYILTCIDVFSRFARAVPVKSKDAINVSAAITKMITKKSCPKNIQTDLGKEFYNKSVQQIFKKHKINHYSVHSQYKAAVVERFNRTLRERLNRFFTHQGNKKWIDALPKIINAYNQSSHKGLKGKRPIDLIETTNLEDWSIQSKETNVTKSAKNLLRVGALVRISRISNSPFRKNFDQNWSEEIFRVATLDKRDIPVMYTLKDLNDEPIEGKFYHEELQDIGDALPKVFRIEKIIRTKGVGKHKRYYVKWYGYDNSRNSWISAKDFVSKNE
jgi:transposase InsO family protein